MALSTFPYLEKKLNHMRAEQEARQQAAAESLAMRNMILELEARHRLEETAKNIAMFKKDERREPLFAERRPAPEDLLNPLKSTTPRQDLFAYSSANIINKGDNILGERFIPWDGATEPQPFVSLPNNRVDSFRPDIAPPLPLLPPTLSYDRGPFISDPLFLRRDDPIIGSASVFSWERSNPLQPRRYDDLPNFAEYRTPLAPIPMPEIAFQAPALFSSLPASSRFAASGPAIPPPQQFPSLSSASILPPSVNGAFLPRDPEYRTHFLNSYDQVNPVNVNAVNTTPLPATSSGGASFNPRSFNAVMNSAPLGGPARNNNDAYFSRP